MTDHHRAPSISILICTLNDRISIVPAMLLAEREDVNYVVSFQYTDDLFLQSIPPELKRRSDVVLLLSPGIGLCANRNNACRHCRAPIGMIADDDSPLSNELIDALISAFSADPQLDIACFEGRRIALRFTPAMPQFDTRFGLGSSYLSCGEEEVLLHQAKTFGLRVRTIATPASTSAAACPPPSPWSRIATDVRVRRSWGALQYMKHSLLVSFLHILAYAFFVRHRRTDSEQRVGFRESIRIFRDMFDGLRYIVTHPLNDAAAEDVPLDFQPIDIFKLP